MSSDGSTKPRYLGPWSQLALVLLVSLMVRLALTPILMNANDRHDYISTAHKAMKTGIAGFYKPAAGYQGVRTESGLRGIPLPYPPIQIYAYQLAGRIYQRFFDPTFYDHTHWKQLPYDSLALNYLIKIPLFLFDLLATAVIFVFLRGRAGDRTALACAALYGLNPAVLYDGALWAQPDAIHAALLTLAVVFIIRQRPDLSLPMLTLAVLSKPQPVIYIPIIMLLAIMLGSARQLMAGALMSSVAGLLILMPLLRDGEALRNMLGLMSAANPYVSANAHNFWWLAASLAGADPGKVKDGTSLFLGVNCYEIAFLLVAGWYAVTAFGIARRARRGVAAEPLAFLGMIFFTFSVRMHENHAFQILPLLLLSGLATRRQRIVFIALSLTILANLALHSPEVVGEETSRLIDWARIANSIANLGIFGYWSYSLLGGELLPDPIRQMFRRGEGETV